MASINDLATAASAVSALATPTAAPQSRPDVAPTESHGEPPPARGALVVLEGLDRSGKTTQVKLLEQRFVELGRKVKVMRFPGMESGLEQNGPQLTTEQIAQRQSGR